MGQPVVLISTLYLLAAVLAAVAAFAWRRRNVPAALPFAGLMLCYAVWAASYALDFSSVELPAKILFLQIRSSAIVFMPVVWMLAILQHVGAARSVKRPLWALVLLVPLVTLLLIWGGDASPVLARAWRYDFRVDAGGALPVLASTPGPWYAIFVVYLYAVILGSSLPILLRFLQSPPPIGNAAKMLIVACLLLPAVAHLLFQWNVSGVTGYDSALDLLLLLVIILAWALFRYRLLDALPAAREVTFASMRDGAIVLDRRGRIAEFNPAARRLIAGPALVSGAPASAAVPALAPLLSRELQGDEVLQEQLRLSESPALIVEARVSALWDAQSAVIGRLVLLRDVTARKQVEEQLNIQSVALRSAANGIVITRNDGIILWVNPALQRMTGYSLEEMVGQHTRMLRSGVHGDAFYKVLWNTVLAGKVWQGEITNRRKDGSLYVEEQMIAPVADEQGEIRYFIAIKQDITERKQVEKLREDLAHTMVHDLRNPLASVMSALQLLEIEGDQYSAQERDQVLEIARRACDSMLALLNSILDVSRLESGQMPLDRRPVQASEMIAATLALEEPIARQRGVSLDTFAPPDLPVDVDAGLITRVLQNLIGNAIKFSPRGQSICVSARSGPENGQVTFCVADSGPGIAPEVQSQLFQKFVTGRIQGRGSGLGLAFCRLAVEAHHGRIWVESSPGQGATFSFTVPAAP